MLIVLRLSGGIQGNKGNDPKGEIEMTEIYLIKDVINVMGVEVVCILEKIVDVATVYYSVNIGGVGQEVFGPEEYARKIYEDCKARAMQGPVDGKYFFLSDKDREDALAEYKQCPWYKEGK